MAKTFDFSAKVTFRADTDLSSYQYYAAIPASTQDYIKLATGASNPRPIGIIQTDSADAVGDAVDVVSFGFTKAVVTACMDDDTACDVDAGHYLQVGKNGTLHYASCGLANAWSVDHLASGSAILNVFWLGAATCAHSAS